MRPLFRVILFCAILMFLNLTGSAQIPRNSFYFGPSIDFHFAASNTVKYFDAGGNGPVAQPLFSNVKIYQSFVQKYNSEPFELMGPSALEGKNNLGIHLSGGYFIKRNWSVGLGLSAYKSTYTGDLVLSLGNPDMPTLVSGELLTNLSQFAVGVNSTYYFGKVWQPLFKLEVGVVKQKADSSEVNFDDLSYNTGSEISTTNLALGGAIGLSRIIAARHQILLTSNFQFYKPDYSSETLIDPQLNIGYRYLLIPSSKQKNPISVNHTNSGIQYCGGQGDFKEELDSLFAELDSIGKAEENARNALAENDLVKEIESIKKLMEALSALDQLESAGSEALDALEDFVGCDNTKLSKLFKESEETRDGVINSLKFLSTFLKIYAEKNKKHSAKLNKIAKIIDDKIEKAEKALKQGNIDVALEIVQSIKTSISWPIEVLKTILDDLWKQIDDALADAGKTGAKKALEVLLKKALGASAGAAASIAQDVINMVDLLWKWHVHDDLLEAWNSKLIEILKKMKENDVGAGEGWADGCANWSMDSIASITISVELVCWCPSEPGSTTEGTWETSDLDLDPSDEGNSKTITILDAGDFGHTDFNIYIPPKSERPCKSDYCYLKLDITAVMKDGTTVTGGGFANAVN